MKTACDSFPRLPCWVRAKLARQRSRGTAAAKDSLYLDLENPVDLEKLADVVAKALRAARANPFRSAEP